MSRFPLCENFRRWFGVAIAGSVCLSLAGLLHAGEPLFESRELFVGGLDGIREFRIPALLTTNRGTLVAVCDARVSKTGDAINNIDLAMKRSFDRGRTWEPMRMIADFQGEEAACDPALVFNHETGTLWVFYVHTLADPAPPGRKREPRVNTLHAMWSNDEGETWSAPIRITPGLRDPDDVADWEALCVGPGRGVQTRDARLLVPCYSRGSDVDASRLLFSTDHGSSWQVSTPVTPNTNESGVVELNDGSWMLNMRSYRGQKCRAVATTQDKGKTWSPVVDARELPEPTCQASIVRHTSTRDGHAKDRLIFSNPADPNGRTSMTVRVSYDEGESWPTSRLLYSGPSAYSCLTVLDDGTIGLLYEHGRSGPYEKITFARFNLEWLTGGKDGLAPDEVIAFEAASTFRADGGGTVVVGTKKQLFVDDYAVARAAGVKRNLGNVRKENGGRPVMVPDQPWETRDILVGGVFRDGDKFRMYYKCGYLDPEPSDPPGSAQLRVGYAESPDGIHWTKPRLGRRLYDGSRDNNLVYPGAMNSFLDSHETDPAHKYKAAYSHWQKMCASLAYSADGFEWKVYNDGEPVTHRAADTLNHLMWDEDAGVYRLITRTDYQRRLGADLEVRGTRDMVNPDIKSDPKNWTTKREWLLSHDPREGDDEWRRRQIYSLNASRYAGILFGLVWTIDWPDDKSEGPNDLERRHERDTMNAFLVTARGDEMWDLRWIHANQPLIPRGHDGDFDKDWIQPAIRIVTWNDRHWLFYAGHEERHGMSGPRRAAVGLATLRLDGFVGLQAEGDDGVVDTKPFRIDGPYLEVNVDASGGEVAIEMLDRQGRPIPGFTRRDAQTYRGVDELRLRPAWKSNPNLLALVGKMVRVRFRLRGATLYSFQIRE